MQARPYECSLSCAGASETVGTGGVMSVLRPLRVSVSVLAKKARGQSRCRKVETVLTMLAALLALLLLLLLAVVLALKAAAALMMRAMLKLLLLLLLASLVLQFLLLPLSNSSSSAPRSSVSEREAGRMRVGGVGCAGSSGVEVGRVRHMSKGKEARRRVDTFAKNGREDVG